VHTQCPICKRRIKVPDILANRKLRCGNCGAPLVPTEVGEFVYVEDTATTARLPTREEKPISVLAQPGAPAVPAQAPRGLVARYWWLVVPLILGLVVVFLLQRFAS
jgi:hypothetical protein